LKIYEIAIVLKNHEEPMYVVISTFPLAHSKKRFTHKEDIKPWIANILEATQAWRNTMSPEEYIDFEVQRRTEEIARLEAAGGAREGPSPDGMREVLAKYMHDPMGRRFVARSHLAPSRWLLEYRGAVGKGITYKDAAARAKYVSTRLAFLALKRRKAAVSGAALPFAPPRLSPGCRARC
jgi:hypothetical protein